MAETYGPHFSILAAPRYQVMRQAAALLQDGSSDVLLHFTLRTRNGNKFPGTVKATEVQPWPDNSWHIQGELEGVPVDVHFGADNLFSLA